MQGNILSGIQVGLVLAMKNNSFRIFTAALSPINSQGNLKSGMLGEFCQYLINEGGSDGVAPLGTTGEGTSLPFYTRKNIPQLFSQLGFYPSDLILGVGCPALQDTVELIHRSLEFGFTQVLVLPPFYYKNVNPEGLYSYYSTLIEAVNNPEVRIHLYHFPQMSMVPIPAEIVKRLFQDYSPMIWGLKDSSGDFTQTRTFVEATGGIESGFHVYPSSEEFIPEAMEIGCAGIISGSLNAFGKLTREAFNGGKLLNHVFEKVVSARHLAQKYPLIPAMKTYQALLTKDSSWENLCPPLIPLTTQEKRRFILDLEELGLFPNGET